MNNHKNIHCTISWDVNSARFSVKLTYLLILSFVCLLRYVWLIIQVTAWKGLLGREPEFCSTTKTCFHEHFGREPNCSRWEMFKNGGLTVLVCISNPENQEYWWSGAGENRCVCSNKIVNGPILCLFVLFRPSIDWMMTIHIGEGDLL